MTGPDDHIANLAELARGNIERLQAIDRKRSRLQSEQNTLFVLAASLLNVPPDRVRYDSAMRTWVVLPESEQPS